jgi:hypothetical protein
MVKEEEVEKEKERAENEKETIVIENTYAVVRKLKQMSEMIAQNS